MREIKFRAWHIIDKKYIYFDFTNIYGYEGEVCGVVLPNNENLLNYNSGFGINGINKDLLIEQFTGLHDKNGKDIYEGDICSVDGGENIYEIIFYMGGFMGAVLPRKIRIYHIGDSLFNNIEIIGDIHQNPELTK